MDTGAQVLTLDQVKTAQSAGRAFLLTWSKLASDAWKAGEANYKLRPKHHYFDHIIESLSTRENPRFLYCFTDEDFMGRVSNLQQVATATFACNAVCRNILCCFSAGGGRLALQITKRTMLVVRCCVHCVVGPSSCFGSFDVVVVLLASWI